MAGRSSSFPAFRVPAYSVQAAGISQNVNAITWPAGDFGADTLQYKVYSDGVFLRNIAPGLNGTTETGLSAGTTRTYEVIAESTSGALTWGGQAVATTLTSPLVFQETFEGMPLSGTTATPGWLKQAAILSDVSFTTEQARSGDRSVKFDFRYADWTNDNLGNRRMLPAGLGYEPTIGEDAWVGVSIFIDDSWEADLPDNHEVLFQWHGQGGGPARLSPPLALFGNGDLIQINICAEDASFNCSVDAPSAVALASFNLADLRGRWVDFVFKVKWAYTDGTVDVWMDGDKVVTYAGPTLYHCDGQVNELGPQWSCGPYKWNWGTLSTQVSSRVMYIDEVRFGGPTATYDDVKPRD